MDVETEMTKMEAMLLRGWGPTVANVIKMNMENPQDHVKVPKYCCVWI